MLFRSVTNPVGVKCFCAQLYFAPKGARKSASASVTMNIAPLRGSAGEIGNMLAVKVRYRQGVASQSGSESWGGGSNTAVQALTGERIGWV